MKNYDHRKIEKKWQNEWEKKGIYHAKEKKGKKFYSLIEFPYPSGAGLHVGHIRSNTAMDIVSRKRRMEGYNVLYPIGWDAFGLPTENYAIKTGIPPSKVTKQNTDTFRKQLKQLGFSFDWSREINTTDPKYYKWTQWIFLQFFKKGLAYKAKIEINWCPKDKIGLANEEVVDGKCERCGTPVEKKEKEQWMLAITKYADRLDKDLDLVDYPERVKLSQRNWIGKSDGAEIDFQLNSQGPSLPAKECPLCDKEQSTDLRRAKDCPLCLSVFTTRPDTIFGATYVVVAPEHPLIDKLHAKIKNFTEVKEYIQSVKKKSEIERTAEGKEKTGVELKGIKAINPANQEEIPVWVADYVLSKYGTGAVMAVPAHDERDYDFAQKYNLPIRNVIDAGLMINSGQFSGMDSEKSKKEIVKFVGGKIVTKFKLRDWVFSRQRYWGEPIPIINCEKCGLVPMNEKDLPLELPKVKSYQPTDTGESPLATITKWVNIKCPKCKGVAHRETDTMPNWAGSSWYYLRYTDPKNKTKFADLKKIKYWLGNDMVNSGVNWYNGGMEHTTLHLLYSRFWHKFLYDLKLVPGKEPYLKRTSHGMILGEGGIKMSKSLGNTINPDDIVKTYGADTLRVYEMFIGPFEDYVAWNTESIIGSRRFIEKVWRVGKKITQENKLSEPKSLTKLLHKTTKKVSEDIENMRFNTAISAMMILVSEMESSVQKGFGVTKKSYKTFLQILAPFAPHLAEELWIEMGEKKSINLSKWPKWDPSLLIDDQIKIVVQINGKVRAEIEISIDESEENIKQRALKNESILRHLEGKEPKRVIWVKNKLINIVI